VKRGTPNHPKTLELAKILKVPRVYAVGILEQLFHFTAEYAPKGDIGKHSDSRIAAAFDRDERSGTKLIRALIEARWIDVHPSHRLVVHDWLEHATTGTKNKVAAIDKLISSNQQVRGTRLESHTSETVVPPIVSPPVTYPPALPYLTKPYQAEPEPPAVSTVRRSVENPEMPSPKTPGVEPTKPAEKSTAVMPAEFQNGFENLYNAWKKPGHKQIAQQYLIETLNRGSPLDVVIRGVTNWISHWERTGWRYCKQNLAETIAEETWKMSPPAEPIQESINDKAIKLHEENQRFKANQARKREV
jgi:hypothetical protein